jgi:hypothetical protein
MTTSQDDKNESVNLAALSIEQMADVLSKASGKAIDIRQVQTDVADGAPVDADGKLNLLAYAAWLARAAQQLGH